MKNKKRNSTNKNGRLLIYTGLVLISLSTGFLIYQNNRLESKKEEAIKLETLLTKENDLKVNTTKNKGAEKKNENTSITSISDTGKDEIAEEYLSAIGVVRVDKIGVVLPILENASNQSLLEGAGIVEGTDLPSSKENIITVLAGHRGGGNEEQTFLNIDKLEKGDDIKISTRKEILYYKVTGEEVIEPDDWSRFIREKEKTKLYLMSCHPYPQNYQRLLIKAELIKDTEINANEEVQ